MSRYDRSHFSDPVLRQRLTASAAHDHAHTAELLADIAEFDARKLYLPAAHPSMFSYCVHELHYGEDAALLRIRAARAAREFPAILDAVAAGRLGLTAVLLLAPHLTAATADDLLSAAAFKTKDEIRLLLAERFPKPDVPTRAETIPTSLGSDGSSSLIGPAVAALGLDRVAVAAPAAQVAPLAPGRHAVQFTMDQEAWELLRRAQELLGHQLHPGDIAGVIKRALQALVPVLEKRKFAATDRPRGNRRRTSGIRHVPADVKRAVWERDGGQCTFVSDTGKRCPARTTLEFDHVQEVARGGRATIEGMRLRCRAHNQYTAERTFGVDFMRRKRELARQAAAWGAPSRSRSQAPAGTSIEAPAAEKTPPSMEEGRVRSITTGASAMAVETKDTAAVGHPSGEDRDVVSWLRRLGFRPDEARRAAAISASMPDATLEELVQAALRFLRPRVAHRRPILLS